MIIEIVIISAMPPSVLPMITAIESLVGDGGDGDGDVGGSTNEEEQIY